MRRIALVLLASATLAACGQGSSEKAVANVAGQAINRGQLDETVDHFKQEAAAEGQDFPEAGSNKYRTVQHQLLGLLVYREELVQSAARLGAKVTDDEVAQRSKSAGGEEQEAENDGFAENTIRAQIAYEHIYAKVTRGLPLTQREAAMRAWLEKMKGYYAGKVTYASGFGSA
jgi:SurA N-terminal domain